MIARDQVEGRAPGPLVSICIPTYNNAALVADALRSALAQTHQDLEIVVLDNHSTDATQDVVQRTSGGDPRVRYIRHSENVGMVGNFNEALVRSTGELLLILCADDVLEPTCVSVLSAALADTPRAVMAACSRRLVDEQLKPLKVRRPRPRRETVDGARMILECFARGNVVGEPSAVLFRRAAAEGGFSETYHQLLDLAMWMRLFLKGDIVCLPDVLTNIRQHASQWSNTNLRSGRLIADKRSLFRELAFRIEPRMSKTQKWLWDVRMAVSVGKTQQTNGRQVEEVSEVFYPAVFPALRKLATAFYSTSTKA